ncbi:hypothetical protein [Alienimonas chondri]|uniref:HEAT repeat domain-containing protein n=1 Tax=Alienimonas chondri TaxID=2681879 RepID=A0ABX1VCZ6_9PLAN|nr:hypothetical protein [Alienimonas chondri]NNJ25385.1 hypothetical protein [Alienimonas chondri]
MFGLFKPRPPLEVHEQAWVERHLTLLAGLLGPQRMGLSGGGLPQQLLPSQEITGLRSEADAERLFDRILDRLAPNAPALTLAWFDGDALLETDPAAIPVPRTALADPMSLAAGLVRQACRRTFHSELSAAARQYDLAGTALGLGLPLANADAPAPSTGETGDRDLTSREIGYALALLWHVRQEGEGSTDDPPWVDELRGDAAGAVTGGLKYLRKVGDARFNAASLRGESDPTEAEIRTELRHRRPARRLAATWDAAQLSRRESVSPGVESATLHTLLETLHDREPAVRAGACGAVAALWPDEDSARDDWDRCLLGLTGAADDPIAAVRAAALSGLGMNPDLPSTGAGREELNRVTLEGLASRTPAVRQAASALACALPPAESGGAESPFAPATLKALVGALVRVDGPEIAEHVATLRTLHPDPAALAEERVDDGELLARALDALGVAELETPEAEEAAVAT